MSATPHPQPPRLVGDYELLAPLGRGGMAEVFRARVRSGPREGWLVALKMLLPTHARDRESVSLFADEAMLTQVLDHPNIVKTLDVGMHEGCPYLVMELVDGRDLAQILKRCRARAIPLPVDFGVYLAKTLLEALAYAHGAVGTAGEPLRLVHCDVSPSNVFISRVGEIKLGDFGVARALRGPSAGVPDVDGEVLGKPYYLSPDVLRGAPVTPAADLWAAAVVLYELLTLQRPFAGKDLASVQAAIRSRAYQPLRAVRPDVPAELDAVMARAFAGDPAQRFHDAAEFARALEPHYDERVGTPLAIAAVVRGLFGAAAGE